MAEYKKEEANYKQVVSQINSELQAWNPALVAVTKDVFFNLTAIVEKARKNYFGVFDEPQDPITKLDKVFVPFTESTVEGIVKAVDLDTKDILLFPTKMEDAAPIKFLRFVTKQNLERINFGQTLNDILRTFVIDGTAVVKVVREYDKELKKKRTSVKLVDRLNFFIDPAADTIQSASAIIERSIMRPDELEAYKGKWKYIDEVKKLSNAGKTTSVSPVTFEANQPEANQIEVFERWGLGSKACRLRFEGKEATEADEKEMEEQVQIFSGLGGGRSVAYCHFVGKNPSKKGYKPYEEVWYRRMANRWDGRGVPEQTFGIQEYLNTIFNIRKNNALILQNGIFLIRKGSPITPQMISSIYAGGTIPVADIERDIKQLPVQDVRQSSYSDEDRGALWGDRVTGARKADEVLGASTPATIGLIQQQNVRDIFDLIQEGVGFFLERLLKRHLIPMFLEDMDNGDVLRISGSTKDLQELDEVVVNNFVEKHKLAYFNEHGFMPEAKDLDEAKRKARKELESLGNNRFVQFAKSVFDPETDVQIVVTNEKLDKAVVVQALRDVLLAASRLPGSNLDSDRVIDEITNILGVNADFFKKESEAEEDRMMMAGGMPQSIVGPGPRPNQEITQTLPNATQLSTVANRLPNTGMMR